MWKYKIGTVVVKDDDDEEDNMYGHITGFTRNTLDETILLVKWDRYDDERPCHPRLVILEADFN